VPALLLPNRFEAEVALEAGRAVRVPATSAGFRLRARLPDGRERERQRLLAVATLDPVTFAADSFTALNRWLLRIPVARRAVSLWEYEVGP